MRSGNIPDELRALRQFSSCAIANAIESLKVRLRNEGFTDGSIRRFTSNSQPAVGYAATIKIRCSSPPPDATSYLERTQWWDYLLSVPAPRFLVIEDVDPNPGTGALVGGVHATILHALGCDAVVTNGAVRDVDEVGVSGFSMFATRLSVSHAYSHIVEAGTPVEVGGLAIAPGDLLHGDCHGVIRIPENHISRVLASAIRIQQQETAILKLCQTREFSIERLREAIRATRAQT